MKGPCVGYLLTGEVCRRPGEVLDEEIGGLLCADCAAATRERRAATGTGRVEGLVGAVLVQWGHYGDGTGGTPDFVDREHSTWLSEEPRDERNGD
ncbi:MAG TPA: hypothetical protein VM283_00670 [Armatimonadota bacterium]|nr:hypothetical protein [Armatimonadota bacterium]